MRTSITTRHCEIADRLRDRTVLVMERLATLSDRALEATVVFDREGVRHTAELRLQTNGGTVLVAAAEGDDHRTALDRAEAKLRRQLLKAAAKPRTRRHPRSAAT